MRKLVILIMCSVFMLFGCGDDQDKETEKMDHSNVEKETEVADTEDDDAKDKENWVWASGSDFHNGIAYVRKENVSKGIYKVVAIDTEGKELFTFSEDSTEYKNIIFDKDYDLGDYKDERNVDKEGEYIWYGDASLDREGNILFDIADKYTGQAIGNGYMLVKEEASGYQQQGARMGVVDGYGNEVIAVSEEFGELCGGELPRPNCCKDGIVDFDNKELILDANQPVYYEGIGGYTDCRNGILLSGETLFKDQGSVIVDLDLGGYQDRDIALSDDVVVVMESDNPNYDGVVFKTFDLNGNLVNENNISDIELDGYTDMALEYEDGLSALYIDGMDGHYVTVVDEMGNFQFEPLKHSGPELSENVPEMYSQLSGGLLRVAEDESTTFFVDATGEEVLRLPYNVKCVGNCEDGRVVVNTGTECFYVDVQTGEYIE